VIQPIGDFVGVVTPLATHPVCWNAPRTSPFLQRHWMHVDQFAYLSGGQSSTATTKVVSLLDFLRRGQVAYIHKSPAPEASPRTPRRRRSGRPAPSRLSRITPASSPCSAYQAVITIVLPLTRTPRRTLAPRLSCCRRLPLVASFFLIAEPGDRPIGGPSSEFRASMGIVGKD